MLKRIHFPSTLLFLVPIGAAVALFAMSSLSCQTDKGGASGSIKLLYTSEVGGRLDPCG